MSYVDIARLPWPQHGLHVALLGLRLSHSTRPPPRRACLRAAAVVTVPHPLPCSRYYRRAAIETAALLSSSDTHTAMLVTRPSHKPVHFSATSSASATFLSALSDFLVSSQRHYFSFSTITFASFSKCRVSFRHRWRKLSACCQPLSISFSTYSRRRSSFVG